MSKVAAAGNAPTGTGRWAALGWLARLIVGALFVYTGWTKIIDPPTFLKEVRAYELLPVALTNSLALALPWLEVLAGLALISGLWRREGRWLLAGMLVVFVVAKAIVMAQGRRIDCGCVPTSSFLHFLFNGAMGLVTNIVLLAMLALEAWQERRRRPPAQPRAAMEEPVPA